MERRIGEWDFRLPSRDITFLRALALKHLGFTGSMHGVRRWRFDGETGVVLFSLLLFS